MHERRTTGAGSWLAGALALLVTALLPLADAKAQATGGFDEALNVFLSPASNLVAGIVFFSIPINGAAFPLIVGWLVVGATVLSFYFGFVQLRKFGHSISLVKGTMRTRRTPARSRISRRWRRRSRARWASATSRALQWPSPSAAPGRRSG